MLIYGVLLYLFWGIILLFSPNAMGATVMGIFKDNNISNISLSFIFICSALMTFFGLFLKNSVMSLIFCFPQQLLLLFNSLSCVVCIFKQQYADGVERSFSFILADQIPFVLATFIHFMALLDMCLFSNGIDKTHEIDR